MAHKPQAVLGKELAGAASKVEAGSVYAHYKNPDDHYLVVGFVILEATDEAGIVYQALYGKHITYVRSAKSWLEKVELDGKQVKRFTKVG
jgi:hypothetical protein